MMLPYERIRSRLAIEKEESDAAYFFALMYSVEMLYKLIVTGLVAGIRDDRDRHRYRKVYSLLRADSLGYWADVLDDVLTGPTAQFLDPEARVTQRQLTENSSPESWQYQLCSEMAEALDKVGAAELRGR